MRFTVGDAAHAVPVGRVVEVLCVSRLVMLHTPCRLATWLRDIGIRAPLNAEQAGFMP